MKRIIMFLTNKKGSIVIFCVLCCLLLFMSGLAYGGIIYHQVSAIGGGGGTCSGGPFKLTGTIGQPVVGHCSGGPFAVASGFSLSPTPPSLTTGDLEGWVWDRYENLIPERFTPRVIATDSQMQTKTDTPDSSGYFLITGLYTGPAAATAQATGYHSDIQYVNIVAGTKSELRFLLRPVSLPSVRTDDATNISGISATLNGELTGLGGFPEVKVGFWLGTRSGGPYYEIDVGYRNTPGLFNKAITGLSEGTTYYFKARAYVVEGDEKSFTTRPVEPPVEPPQPPIIY